MIKLAIVGSRNFENFEFAQRKIESLPFYSQITHIVSGGARGADTIAKKLSHKFGFELIEFIPDWSEGRSAGIKRNSLIIQECDLLIAFWDGESRGTLDSIKKASKAGKLWSVIKFEEEN